MAAISLELPTIQNWSCHNCGGCCRQHAIYVTEAEEQPIIDQKWTDLPTCRLGSVFVADGPSGQKRLATRDDGECALMSRGLCRIHARFDEPAKAACLPDISLRVSSCGRRADRQLAVQLSVCGEESGRARCGTGTAPCSAGRQVLPSNYKPLPPPELVRGQKVSWRRFSIVWMHWMPCWPWRTLRWSSDCGESWSGRRCLNRRQFPT